MILLKSKLQLSDFYKNLIYRIVRVNVLPGLGQRNLCRNNNWIVAYGVREFPVAE